jgi:hypothetical protein
MRSRSLLALVSAAAVIVAAFVFVSLTAECGAAASCPATARVDDRTYVLGIARNLRVEPSALVRYAPVTRRTGGDLTLDEDAYRLGEVDPAKILVMKLAPGQTDGAGALGEYLLLVSDASAWSLTCPFFSADDTLRPTVCSEALPT